MLKQKTNTICILILITIIAVCVPVISGTYKDSDGNSHVWRVDEKFTLQWDGAPYVPFAFAFTPKTLLDAQNPESINLDKAALEELKAVGITDVFLKPGKGIATSPVEAFQQVIDLLEELGFSYGIQLIDSQPTPLQGYVVDPSKYRIDGITSSEDQSLNVQNVHSLIYALADSKSGKLKQLSRSKSANGEFTIPIALGAKTEHVVIFFPYKTITATTAEPNIPDIWADYDKMRDIAISYLELVKFGKGLRYFADPFGDAIALSGDAVDVIPNSERFRFEYGAWLSKKYKNINTMSKAWCVDKYNPESYTEAASFIPFWNKGRGLKYVYDVAVDKIYDADANRSKIWEDLISFRETSIKAYLGDFADVIRKEVADVPVIHTVNGLNSVFQSASADGYNGLAASIVDSSSVTPRAGMILSMAENSATKPWIISKITPKADEFTQKDALYSVLNNLHGLGSKGFIIDSQTPINSDASKWFSEYAALSRSDSVFTGYAPRVIYYPSTDEKLEPKKLASGAWWLPILVDGRNVHLGSTMSGYVLDSSVGPDNGIYLWSLKDPQRIHVYSKTALSVTKASGETADAVPNKKGIVEIDVDIEPIVVRGTPVELFIPSEVVQEAIDNFAATIKMAEDMRIDTGSYQQTLKQAKAFMEKNNFTTAFQVSYQSNEELKQRLKGMEGINPAVLGIEGSSGK